MIEGIYMKKKRKEDAHDRKMRGKRVKKQKTKKYACSVEEL